MSYELTEVPGGVPVKSWTHGVPVEDKAWAQLRDTAMMPFIHRWVAAMPDVHLGIGATVGSVVPTRGAIIPAAVGVDIGCGMVAMRTSLTADVQMVMAQTPMGEMTMSGTMTGERTGDCDA